ncbi:MAG TPA: NAD(P)-binding protein [Thermodesulfobacteriota bacterium]|nr:NAD(P)-binding protein [Thermodesulfobacteriota bacterium]
MGKQIPFNRESEMPSIAVSQGDMAWNKTGSWRTQRPFYEDKTPPCNAACPAGNDIVSFILKIVQGDFEGAWNLIREENPFPGICGRVCFHPCEQKCNRGSFDDPLAIRALERFVAEFASHLPSQKINLLEKERKSRKRKEKIAIIGAGPAGMSCAYHLARLHYNVTVFEALPSAGGVLRTGIPSYRLPREVLDRELSTIETLGAKVKTGMPIGQEMEMEDLKDYSAIFVAAGAHRSRQLRVPGEKGRNVSSGLDFLKAINLGKEVEVGRRIAIIGGGNTAIDVARSLVRLGKNPIILYRRSREEMPAFEEEVIEALEEGVEFRFLVSPIRILEQKGIKRLECLRMKLAEKDETGRRRPVAVSDSQFLIEAEQVIVAAGEEVDVSFLSRGIRKREGIVLTHTGGGTSVNGIFAGGDFASRERTVAHAIGSGKRSAIAIDSYLKKEDPEKVIQSLLVGYGPSVSIFPYFHPGERIRSSHVVTFEELNLDYFEKAKRVEEAKYLLPERTKGFFEVASPLTERTALEEAERCFNCGTCNECDTCYTFCPDASILKGIQSLSHQVDYDFCKGCGICYVECPRRAISLKEEER